LKQFWENLIARAELEQLNAKAESFLDLHFLSEPISLLLSEDGYGEKTK